MNSLNVRSIALVYLTLLIAGACGHKIRCYRETKVVENSNPKQESVFTKCVLSPVDTDSEFDRNSPTNINLGYVESKPNFVYRISISNSHKIDEGINASTFSQVVDLNAMVKGITSDSFSVSSESFPCDFCYDPEDPKDANDPKIPKNKPNSSRCLFGYLDFSPELSVLTGRRLSAKHLFCNLEPTVLISPEKAATDCPKSTVYVINPKDAKVKLQDGTDSALGFVAISHCTDASGKQSKGIRLFSHAKKTGYPLMNICEDVGKTTYSTTDGSSFSGTAQVAHGKEMPDVGTYSTQNFEEIVPAGSPVYFKSVSCPNVRYKRFTYWGFRLNFDVPLNTPWFKTYVSSLKRGQSAVSKENFENHLDWFSPNDRVIL